MEFEVRSMVNIILALMVIPLILTIFGMEKQNETYFKTALYMALTLLMITFMWVSLTL